MEGGRITSYNVCYTKLLRVDEFLPDREDADGVLVVHEGVLVLLLDVFFPEPKGVPNPAFGVGSDAQAEAMPRVGVAVEFGIDACRITSYNVCYTKLLRPMAPRRSLRS